MQNSRKGGRNTSLHEPGNPIER